MFKVNDEETRTKSLVLVLFFFCSYDCWLEACICLWVYACPTNYGNVDTAVHNCSTEMLPKNFWETLTKTFLMEIHQLNYYLPAIIILTGKQHILRIFQYTQKVWILKSCVKLSKYGVFFWSVISRIRTEYGDLRNNVAFILNSWFLMT